MAFIVNALFIAGTIVEMGNKKVAIAAVAGGIGLPFYVGNIDCATNAARKWNGSFKIDMRDNLSISIIHNGIVK